MIGYEKLTQSDQAKIKDWLEDFIAQPHPSLKRTGAVCPFMPRALRLNTVYYKSLPSCEFGVLQNEIALAADALKKMAAPSDPNYIYNVILLMLPPVDGAELDRVRLDLKHRYVHEKIMLGVFHPESRRSSIHHDNFFPLQSPVPMIAVRHLVETDLPFLIRDCDPLERRQQYLQAYFQVFGDKDTDAENQKIAN